MLLDGGRAARAKDASRETGKSNMIDRNLAEVNGAPWTTVTGFARFPLAIALMAFGLAGEAHAGPDDHVTLGAGVAAVPDFEGADDYRILPVPVLDVQMGRFFAGLRSEERRVGTECVSTCR